MNKYRFLLDGTEVDYPEGFQEFREAIIRDGEKRIIRFDFPLEFTFIGTGYDYIDSVYQDAYNSEIELTIIDLQSGVDVIFMKGIIKLSNCTFNLSELPKKTVDCEVDDNVYQAAIFNNEKRPVSLGGDETLNGLTLTAITPIDLTVFVISDGSNEPETRTAYDVKDAFQHVLSFLTDNRVSFESDWYDDLADDEKLCIVSGFELLDPTNSNLAPVVTLAEMFEELWKKYNLWMIVETPITNPTLRLESESYAYGSDVVMQLKDVEGLTRFLDFELLYNRVKLGGANTIRELGTNFAFFYIPFMSFAEEEYNITGVINVDRELNLFSRWIIDNNVIADVIENDNDSFNEDTFLIQYTESTSTATKGDYFPSLVSSNRFYNEQLLNANVAARFNYLGDLVMNQGLLDQSFLAVDTGVIEAETILGFLNQNALTLCDVTPVEFDDDSTPPAFDSGNNYDTGTFQYTAPQSGYYRFSYKTAYEVNTFLKNEFLTKAVIKIRMFFVKNGTDTILPDQMLVRDFDGSQPTGVTQFLPQADFNGTTFTASNSDFAKYLEVQQTIFLLENETLEAGIHATGRLSSPPSEPIAIFSSEFNRGEFSNPTTPLAGGNYESVDPDAYYVGVYAIDEIGITDEQMEALKANTSGIIEVDTGNDDVRKCYLRNVSREIINGKSEVELIFNRKQDNV